MLKLSPAVIGTAVLALGGLGLGVHRFFFSRRARAVRRWRILLKRFPSVDEGGRWVKEGYLGFEGGDLAWGSLAADQFEPHGCPLGMGATGLHLHPWPVVQRPLAPWERRMLPLCVSWGELQPAGDRFTFELCENPRLLLHLTAEGARALEDHLQARIQEVS